MDGDGNVDGTCDLFVVQKHKEIALPVRTGTDGSWIQLGDWPGAPSCADKLLHGPARQDKGTSARIHTTHTRQALLDTTGPTRIIMLFQSQNADIYSQRYLWSSHFSSTKEPRPCVRVSFTEPLFAWTVQNSTFSSPCTRVLMWHFTCVHRSELFLMYILGPCRCM